MTQFRIDDIGASGKHFNQHGQKVFRYRGIPFFYFPLANVGFFKRLWPFRKWGVYNELTASEWQTFLPVFKEHGVTPIIAITAAWVEADGTLVPFPKKFPEEAAILKAAADRGDISIANHGLTHCVVGDHRPKFWSGNRKSWREFYDWLSQETHNEHIRESQNILESYFARPVTIFVPPGNVWSKKTYLAMRGTNLRTVISQRYMMDSAEPMQGIDFLDDRRGFFNFHDRELKLFGMPWLNKMLKKYSEV